MLLTTRTLVALLVCSMVLSLAPAPAQAFVFEDEIFSEVTQAETETFPLSAFSTDEVHEESMSAERLLTWMYEQNDMYVNVQRQHRSLSEVVQAFKKPTTAKEVVRNVQELLALDPSLYPSGKIDGIYSPEVERALTALDKRFGRSVIKDKHERWILQLASVEQAYRSARIASDEDGGSIKINPRDRFLAPYTDAIGVACPYRTRDNKDVCKLVPFISRSLMTADDRELKKNLTFLVNELTPALRGLTSAYSNGRDLTKAEKKVMSSYLSAIRADITDVQARFKKGRTVEGFVVSLQLHMNIIQANVMLAILRGYIYEMTDFVEQLEDATPYFEGLVESAVRPAGLDTAVLAKLIRTFHESYAAFAAGDFATAKKLLEKFESDVDASVRGIDNKLEVARQGGREAAIKSSLSGLRSQAEILYNTKNYSYSAVCSDSQIKTVLQSIDKNNQTAAAPACRASATAYVVSALLSPGGQRWCIDSTGYAGAVTREPAGLSCAASR